MLGLGVPEEEEAALGGEEVPTADGTGTPLKLIPIAGGTTREFKIRGGARDRKYVKTDHPCKGRDTNRTNQPTNH